MASLHAVPAETSALAQPCACGADHHPTTDCPGWSRRGFLRGGVGLTAGLAAGLGTGLAVPSTARAQTLTIMGTPPIGASGLSGSRLEAMRAGIRRMGFMRGSWVRLCRPGLALKPDTAYNLCDASPQ